ncbi:MAG TPA: hypothetical protein VK808_03390 [Bacteroidia bacterium]|nr:hypothetical protein [Bacteroidia bacterium]
MKIISRSSIQFFLLLVFLYTIHNNSLSAQNNSINIPGTRLSISPPKGYKLSTEYKGIERNKDIFIKVYDPYNSNYMKYARGFTRESLENGGSEVQDYKKLNISGFPAKYALLQNNAGGKSLFLVFGDSTFTTMVVASCPANKDSDEQQLKAALLSVTYSKTLKTNPLSGAFFNINDTNSAYRFAKCKNDYYIYSSNGAITDPYSGESIISVLPFTSEYTVGDETIARAIMSSYQQYGITDTKTRKESQVQIGTLNATEVEVNAKIDNKKAVLYRLTLVDGKKAILILGIATSDFDKNIDEFRNLAHTVKFK